MNYQKVYDKLIRRRKDNVLSSGDSHHILPKSWGGSDDVSNLVVLTLREHYIAHKLLAKIADTNKKRVSMLSALRFMSGKNSREHERIKLQFLAAMESYMNEVVGNNGETRRQLTTKKSAETMNKLQEDGTTILDSRISKISKHNTVIIDWEHKDGRTFTGTALELSRHFRGELIEPSKMTRNLNTPEYHRGWRSVEGGKNPSALGSKYTTVWTWNHKSGEKFTGTSYQLAMHVKGKQTMHANRIERTAIKGLSLDGWKPILANI